MSSFDGGADAGDCRSELERQLHLTIPSHVVRLSPFRASTPCSPEVVYTFFVGSERLAHVERGRLESRAVGLKLCLTADLSGPRWLDGVTNLLLEQEDPCCTISSPSAGVLALVRPDWTGLRTFLCSPAGERLGRLRQGLTGRHLSYDATAGSSSVRLDALRKSEATGLVASGVLTYRVTVCGSPSIDAVFWAILALLGMLEPLSEPC